MIGKTISHVVDLDYRGQEIHFTDGTLVRVEAQGYETDGVGFTPLTQEDLYAEAWDAAHDMERLRNIKPIHGCDTVFAAIMKQEFEAALVDHMRASNRLLFGDAS